MKILTKLISEEHSDKIGLLINVLAGALLSLELSLATDFLRLPADMRLAFREFGRSYWDQGCREAS